MASLPMRLNIFDAAERIQHRSNRRSAAYMVFGAFDHLNAVEIHVGLFMLQHVPWLVIVVFDVLQTIAHRFGWMCHYHVIENVIFTYLLCPQQTAMQSKMLHEFETECVVLDQFNHIMTMIACEFAGIIVVTIDKIKIAKASGRTLAEATSITILHERTSN